MKQISTEIMPIAALSEEDINKFTAWVWEMRSLNLFDMDVISYPRTVMCKMGSPNEPLLYVPLQSVLMFDSLAPKPGLSPMKEALCLSRMVDEVDEAAKLTGHRETYFFCRDDRVAEIAKKHGFDEIENVRVLKRKHKVEEPEAKVE